MHSFSFPMLIDIARQKIQESKHKAKHLLSRGITENKTNYKQHSKEASQD